MSPKTTTKKERERTKLENQVRTYVAGGFAGLWIRSWDPFEVVKELVELSNRQGWTIAEWDAARGLTPLNEEDDKPKQAAVANPGQRLPATTSGMDGANPLVAIQSCEDMARDLYKEHNDSKTGSDEPMPRVLLVMHNVDKFFSKLGFIQKLKNLIYEAKQGNPPLNFIMISPSVQLPEILEKDFVILDHELPDVAELGRIAKTLIDEDEETIPTDPAELSSVLEAASGLSRVEAEGAFAVSIIQHGELKPDAIWELKAQTLKKTASLTLHRGGEKFDNLGGLTELKRFCYDSLRLDFAKQRKGLRAKGVLLLGVPGAGKSAFCKALGNETNRPLIHFDMGALFGGIVGETEKNVRRALEAADMMSPAILFVDEIEKALSGSQSGKSDGGTGTRLFGTLLTWLSDHKSDVYFVGTCNDITSLPEAFSRAGRFDGIFFFDVPSKSQRKLIWDIHMKRLEIPEQELPNARDWTGAEIEACCTLAVLHNQSLMEAAQRIVPVSQTAQENILGLRQWASNRALSVERPGPYVYDTERAEKRSQKIASGKRGLVKLEEE